MNITRLTDLIRFPRILWGRRNCPLCTSIEFQVADFSSWDRALALFALNPVRCTNCWRRYYWLTRTEKGCGPLVTR